MTPLDTSALLDACGGEPDILAGIVRALQLHLPLTLLAARRELELPSPPRLRDAAHRLIGMVATLSGPAGALASELEDAADAGDLARCSVLLQRLTTMSEALLAALDGISVRQLQARPDP